MNLLIYQPRVSYYVGGGEIVPLEQARWFSKRGHNVTILTSCAAFLSFSDYFLRFKKENPKVKIIELEIPDNYAWIYETSPGTNWKRWDLESLYFSRLALDKGVLSGYDIVAFHNVLDSLSAPLHTPSILHLHGYPEKMNYACELLLTPKRSMVAVSHLVGKKWSEMCGHNNIPVCHNGVDIGRFKPENTEKIYDLLYIGRLIEIKGIQFLIDALAILRDEFNLFPKLAIAGKGNYKEALQERVDQHNLTQQIEFLGYVSDDQLPLLYLSAQITVLPSYAREGVLTTMLESAACGIPTITTAGTSMTEFLVDEVNGLTAAPQDARSLASCIQRLLTDKALREKLGAHALQKIQSGWSWEQKIIELEEIYHRACNE